MIKQPHKVPKKSILIVILPKEIISEARASKISLLRHQNQREKVKNQSRVS